MGAPTSHKASGGNLRLIGLVILAAIAAWPAHETLRWL